LKAVITLIKHREKNASDCLKLLEFFQAFLMWIFFYDSAMWFLMPGCSQNVFICFLISSCLAKARAVCYANRWQHLSEWFSGYEQLLFFIIVNLQKNTGKPHVPRQGM
jgi:uncharacterized membrane protein YhfC